MKEINHISIKNRIRCSSNFKSYLILREKFSHTPWDDKKLFFNSKQVKQNGQVPAKKTVKPPRCQWKCFFFFNGVVFQRPNIIDHWINNELMIDRDQNDEHIKSARAVSFASAAIYHDGRRRSLA